MTEAEWLACEDPRRMVMYLHRVESPVIGARWFLNGIRMERKRTSLRKLLWVVAACAQHFAGAITDLAEAGNRDEARRVLVEAAQQQDLAPGDEVSAAAQERRGYFFGFYEGVWNQGINEVGGRQDTTMLAKHCRLLRDVIGNPFRPVTLDPSWLTPTVRQLAQAAYDERVLPSGELQLDRLAVLADALEEAGCDEPQILSHCRGRGPHVRGCWVVDLLTGRS